MSPARTDVVNGTASIAELTSLLASWQRSLCAQRASQDTVASYRASVERLTAFLAAEDKPTSPDAITRGHIEAFLEHLLSHWKPATAHNRYRG